MNTSYDLVPYESHPFPQTHPDRLAAVAALLGLRPPPVERCRVLELGCASGGNLVPMASLLPGSTFLGIDGSARQIGDGERLLAGLGLPNVTLRHADFMDLVPDLGEFDYVLCHGVYSWVPAAVQRRLFEIIARHLSADGIAYVSYNTYPGWHVRGLIRDMMLYHTKRIGEPAERVGQARAFLDFLAQSVGEENTSYHHILRHEVQLLRGAPDYYLFHEHLEDANEPVYFHQFVQQAESYGLRFVGEADLSVMVPSHFRPEVRDVLHRIAEDHVHLEQYMDFLRNRTFRQSLLARPGKEIQYRIEPGLLAGFFVSSPLTPDPGRADQFRSPFGATVTAGDPLSRGALAALAGCWPGALPFAELCDLARSCGDGISIRDAANASADAERLGRWLLTLHVSGAGRLVELHLRKPSCTGVVGPKPSTTALARLQAAGGGHVTNLRHERVPLPDFDRHLVRHLDGLHDRDSLRATLVSLAERGTLTVTRHGQPVHERAASSEIIEQAIGQRLPILARNALFLS